VGLQDVVALTTDTAVITNADQGSHTSVKVLDFFSLNSRPWKYLKTGLVLESPWIGVCPWKSWNFF